jgi:alkanesulfonate monooxygenase SsuD/methylene tetrahydromethanopterin reductase-like flavin-dependent oxidoreductase (luciferase family)
MRGTNCLPVQHNSALLQVARGADGINTQAVGHRAAMRRVVCCAPNPLARCAAIHSRLVADSLAVLTAAAVATEGVRLGTAILIAAQHTPVQLAKALATIDQISGGRVIAGMGPGWSSDDLRATEPIAAGSSTRRWTSSMPCGGRTR